MGHIPQPPSSDRTQLLLDFPIRLYTALRTIRLYPAANPQVQRSNEFLMKAFEALLEGDADNSVILALSDQKILVCGEHLPEKDHSRPQIQGLVTLFNRFKIHSFTFHASFSPEECITFTQTLSALLGEKELTEPVATLLDKAGIVSVSVDVSRYVAIHEGEQVVREELLASGLSISDEELANFVLGRTGQDPLQGVSPELVEELIKRLPLANEHNRPPEEVTRAVIDFLGKLSRETDFRKRTLELEKSADALSALDPALLAKLIANLPASAEADAMLGSALHQLTPQRLNSLIASLVAQQGLRTIPGNDAAGATGGPGAILHRLAHLEQEKKPEITRTIAQNIDARALLLNPDTTLAELPEHLLARLKQPEWSAPVLATAAQQVTDSQLQQTGQLDFSAFNRLLEHYEQLLSREQQTQVARQAGAQLASMEGLALGNILAQRFKGLFGEQLYTQVINQVSDELLDETVDHLTPKQLNRMIATLTSDIPLQIGKDKDPDFKPADDSVLKRLARTKKGPEITRTIAQNIDARALLLNPSAPSSSLPDPLAMRLQQPAWSAPVLVAATQQSFEARQQPDGPADFSSFEQVLQRYDTLLDKEQQLKVATQAGAQIAATFDEQELGLILVQKYKTLFGEQLYQQVISQLSQDKLAKLTDQFRAIAEGRSPRPGDVDDKEVEAAYNRLLQTVRGEKMRAIIELHSKQRQIQEQERRQSVKGGLDHLLHGNFSDLENKEFCQDLPETVRGLLLNNNEKTADSVLMQLAVALQHGKPAIRANAFRTLAAIAEQLMHLGQWERLAKLLPALQQGLQLQGIDEHGSQQALTAIGTLTGHYLSEERYPLACETTQLLQTLSTAEPSASANPHLRAQAQETLKTLCSQPILEQLLDRYLHSEVHQEAAGRLLVQLGMESAKFQLQQLINNESRFERKRLLSLIKQAGNPAVSILLEQLHKDSPWYVVRNIIRLLGEVGSPALFATIRPYIHHSDPRVQQEVISTAVKIGGDHLKDFLLHALQHVDDSLKIKVINHVATAHDERFVRPLTELLESVKPFLGKSKNDLQISICKTLGAIGSRRATASLNRVAQSKNVLGLAGYSDEVRQAAAQALEQIRQATALQTEWDQEETAAEEQPDSRETTAGPANPVQAAERQRERIDAIDDLPLGEMIRASEIIEQERRGVRTGDDLEIWAELTDRLGTDEFRAIHQQFIERRYKPEETIVAQGEKNDSLFFINQGSIKVSHLVGSRELFITSLNRGQIAGENFFAPSFWTVTLTSLTPSRLYLLPQTALDTWKEQFPGLRAKLYDYYSACNNICSMIERKGLDRRREQRFNLSRKIQVQPISSLENPIGRGFRAETADISLGGLAFLIRISRQENARLLLGRRMQIVLPVGGKAKFFHLKGMVIGVQPFHLQDNGFSAHFKFDHRLEQQELQSILG
ncbi:cyclic nucleotide-binding protein [Desulfobulbus propionicus DSM 2032]|uniref:Cyclic nucleotide-binding protein n=1 Tax=Desulfobulbus propionicus (strain ATCC 33891 / DSM 2032 / VKM B-1956 / 1pr3) TaxID=577650 RepID=A0A7U3YKM1_DESPD|nr:HEAT repeat domain-containing protein [Desulfobulbus propionicus]ADW17117.1 cyclic nucleotide-binding protein [Desulfobulbus propionicus DSM 2032]